MFKWMNEPFDPNTASIWRLMIYAFFRRACTEYMVWVCGMKRVEVLWQLKRLDEISDKYPNLSAKETSLAVCREAENKRW